jgi:hypothetical protein
MLSDSSDDDWLFRKVDDLNVIILIPKLGTVLGVLYLSKLKRFKFFKLKELVFPVTKIRTRGLLGMFDCLLFIRLLIFEGMRGGEDFRGERVLYL